MSSPVPDALSISRIVAELDLEYRAPRSDDYLTSVCRSGLPGGRVVIAGAGTHTSRLLPLLRARKDVEPIAIVDRLANPDASFHGLPVIPPDAMRGLAYDYVLLSHTVYEGEMARRLVAEDVPLEKIIPIYRNSGFAHLIARPSSARPLRPGYDAFIITCFQDVVVGDDDLARVFPPDRTLKLFLGRADSWRDGGVFETVDVFESLALMNKLVAELKPKVVFVQSIIYKNYLAAYLRIKFPRLMVIHELYDYSTIWRDQDLIGLFGLDASSIGRLRESERYSVNNSHLLISKRGGPDWADIESGFGAPYLMYFPQARNLGGSVSPSSDPIKLLYAGFLPAPKFRTQVDSGYTFLRTAKDICALGGYEFNIYNNAHSKNVDDFFHEYGQQFSSGPIKYHSRIEQNELMEVMGRHHYGWLCDPITDIVTDHYVGIGNRWTGYVSGGLPVLIDAKWRFMAEYVSRFDAGLVIEEVDSPTIDAKIKAADHARVAAGTRRLARHMVDHNAETLDRVAAAIEEFRP